MSRPGAGWSYTEWIKRRAGSDGRVRDLTRVHSQRSPTLAYKRTYNSAFVISVFNNTYIQAGSLFVAGAARAHTPMSAIYLHGGG